MTGIEEVTLAYKIGKLTYDSFTAVRTATGSWWKKADFRIVSSLTTIEFEQEGIDQVCYCVQDRTILFRRDKTLLPPFKYGTSGIDYFDELIASVNLIWPLLIFSFGPTLW